MAEVSYEAVVGLEIHVQLATKSKMFCGCNNDSEGARPNQHTCPVCLGLPGALPVPNRQAVEWAVKTARALGCSIPDESKFDRKQYFYPDLPKGYQISQYDQPLGGEGEFTFALIKDKELEECTVGIERLHLEEDAGKLTHPAGKEYSLVDLNRAGTPLMEIVTKPIVIEDPTEAPAFAKVFLQELQMLVRYLGVSSADMEKGHLRADANISLHKKGAKDFGAKVEVKNINSFRFVERALAAEIERQKAMLDADETVIQETRGYDEATSKTVSQRTKEEADDYRYFPEPDIPPLDVTELSAGLDDFASPSDYRRRWSGHGAAPGLIDVAVEEPAEAKALNAAFEAVGSRTDAVAPLWLSARKDPLLKESLAKNDYGLLQSVVVVAAGHDGLTGTQFKLLVQLAAQGADPAGLLETDSRFQPADSSAMETWVEQAIADNPKAAADVKSGNTNAINAILGSVMKASKGSANPTEVRLLVEKKLEE